MKPQEIPGAPVALVFVVLLSSLLSHSVFAATQSSGACQQLASVIEQSVSRTLQAGRGTHDFHDVYAGASAGDLQGCATATATVSRAFANAMRGMGVELLWGNGRTLDPGDYCLSHYLDQCYPRRSGLDLGYALSNDTVIAAAWATVTANVRQAMPFGVQSDIVYFDSTQLATTLTSSLDVTLRTPGWGVQLHQGPARARRLID
ncbi:MAG: hypothetical protein WBM54_07735 [Woeseia sp.]